MKPLFPLALLGTAAFAQPALAQPAPTGAITLELLSTYRTGQFDESAAEIVAHDPRSQRLFIVNARQGALDVLDILDPSAPLAREPVALGVQHVLHLHGLDDAERLARLDILPDRDVDRLHQPRHRAQKLLARIRLQPLRHQGGELGLAPGIDPHL